MTFGEFDKKTHNAFVRMSYEEAKEETKLFKYSLPCPLCQASWFRRLFFFIHKPKHYEYCWRNLK